MFKRIYLEITNHCNLSCPFCISNKRNDYVSIENFKILISKIEEYTNYIYLHVLGEPFSHPNFDYLLSIIDKTNLNVQLVTNGTYLSKYPDILKHKCIRKISISIHSIDYVKLEEEYFENIDKLIFEVSNNTNIKMELRFYNFENLKNNSLKYFNYLKEKYVFENTKKINSFKIKQNVFIYSEKLFKWPNIKDKNYYPNGRCLGGDKMLSILTNGDVVLCCLDPYGHTKIGNIYQQELKDILKNELYLKHLNEMKKNKMTFELCKKCTYKLRFRI